MTDVAHRPTSGSADCPCCRTPASFGPKGVLGQSWTLRCSKCGYTSHERLSKVKKQIVYLDQLVLSHMLSGKETRWKELFQRLQLLTALQLICCPYSKVHREESLLAEQTRDTLKCLYRDLSGGGELLPPYEIEQNQLLRAVGRYLRGETGGPPWQKSASWQEFCKADPHRWTADLSIYADFPLDLAKVQRLQSDKDRLHAELEEVAGSWRGEEARQF